LGLTVRGATGATDYSGIDFRSANSGSTPVGRIALVAGGGGSFLSFGTSNSYGSGVTNTAMTIDPSGDLGVNIAAPNIAGWGKAITLNGNAAASAAYELSFNGALTGYLSYTTSTSQVNLYNFGNAPLQFGTNNTARLIISETGLVTLVSTSGLSIGRTAVTSPAAGDGNVFSGTYDTAQVGSNTNVDSVTFSAAQYLRVGNTVTVSGQITIDATTANTDTTVRMSLPIASNISASRNLGGTGSCISASNFGIQNIAFIGDATNDCVEMRLRPSVNTSLIYAYSFTYQVL
jgi:hypothetical protein